MESRLEGSRGEGRNWYIGSPEVLGQLQERLSAGAELSINSLSGPVVCEQGDNRGL